MILTRKRKKKLEALWPHPLSCPHAISFSNEKPIFLYTHTKKKKKKIYLKENCPIRAFVLNHEAQKYLLKTQILMRKKFHLGCMYFLNIAFGQKRFNS